MPPSTRAAARAQTERDILRLGREHLARYGAAALSLRAIARDLDIVSSAVYRYVGSRDELLTALVVDAYTELAAAVEADISALTQPRDRIVGAAQAMRAWAVREPARWALLYGSPVPNYHAPADATTAPGTAVMAVLLTEMSRMPAPTGTPINSTIAGFDSLRTEFASEISDATICAGITIWNLIIGSISTEVFGHYGPAFPDAHALFDAVITRTLDQLFANQARTTG